jgi:hypothetical protein
MIWGNREAVFTDLWGVAGQSPAEGGSGKAVGFAAGGKAFPLLFILQIVKRSNHFIIKEILWLFFLYITKF